MFGGDIEAKVIEVACSAGIFILLWVVLGKHLFKPYLALIEAREARTLGDERKAAELATKAEEVKRQIDEELKVARLRGLQVRDAAVNAAKEQAKVIADRAAERARRELEAARDEIELARAQAQREIDAEADELAKSLLARLLVERGASQTIH